MSHLKQIHWNSHVLLHDSKHLSLANDNLASIWNDKTINNLVGAMQSMTLSVQVEAITLISAIVNTPVIRDKCWKLLTQTAAIDILFVELTHNNNSQIQALCMYGINGICHCSTAESSNFIHKQLHTTIINHITQLLHKYPDNQVWKQVIHGCVILGNLLIADQTEGSTVVSTHNVIQHCLKCIHKVSTLILYWMYNGTTIRSTHSKEDIKTALRVISVCAWCCQVAIRKQSSNNMITLNSFQVLFVLAKYPLYSVWYVLGEALKNGLSKLSLQQSQQMCVDIFALCTSEKFNSVLLSCVLKGMILWLQHVEYNHSVMHLLPYDCIKILCDRDDGNHDYVLLILQFLQLLIKQQCPINLVCAMLWIKSLFERCTHCQVINLAVETVHLIVVVFDNNVCTKGFFCILAEVVNEQNEFLVQCILTKILFG